MNSHAASFFFEPAGMPRPWLLEPGKLPFGPGRHQAVAHGLLHRALGVLGERHHPGDGLGAHVGAARHLRAHRLVVGIGQDAVRPVLDQQVGVPLGRRRGLRRVERRRQVVRRRLEHRAAHAHQVGNPVPVMQLVGGEGGDALLVVDRVAHLDQLVEGLGQAEARLARSGRSAPRPGSWRRLPRRSRRSRPWRSSSPIAGRRRNPPAPSRPACILASLVKVSRLVTQPAPIQRPE